MVQHRVFVCFFLSFFLSDFCNHLHVTSLSHTKKKQQTIPLKHIHTHKNLKLINKANRNCHHTKGTTISAKSSLLVKNPADAIKHSSRTEGPGITQLTTQALGCYSNKASPSLNKSSCKKQHHCSAPVHLVLFLHPAPRSSAVAMAGTHRSSSPVCPW